MADLDAILFDLGGVMIELAGVERMLEWSPGLGTTGELWRRWLASPAVRVMQTLDAFREGMGSLPEAVWGRRIYLASSANLLDVLHETDASVGTLMLAGHNPGLEDLILELVADDGSSPLRDIVEAKLPTATLACLSWDGTDWASLDAKSGLRLTSLTRPRDLDPSLGPDADH